MVGSVPAGHYRHTVGVRDGGTTDLKTCTHFTQSSSELHCLFWPRRESNGTEATNPGPNQAVTYHASDAFMLASTTLHGCGQMRVATRLSCKVFSPARTKCSLNWRTRTITPSTKAQSHLSFQKRLRPKSIGEADGFTSRPMRRIIFVLVAVAAAAGDNCEWAVNRLRLGKQGCAGRSFV